jgi:hypothetical protein
MVEVALITPLLLLLLGGVGDLGRAFYYKIAVTNTAREAAHWATLGPAPTDDQILNLVSTPSQESYGICLAPNGPNCSSGNGGLAPSSVVNAAPGTMTPQELANPSGAHLSPGHSYLYIYPGFSGRTSPLALGMHWAEVASSSRTITAPGPDQGGLQDVLKAVGGSLYPVTADADPPPPSPPSTCYTWSGVQLSQTSFTTQDTPTYTVGLIATLTDSSGSGQASNTANFTVNQIKVPSFQQTWASNGKAAGSIDPSSTKSDTVTMSDNKAATPGTYLYQVQVTSTGGGCTQQDKTANFMVTIPPGPSPSPSPSPSPTATPTATPSTSPAPTPSGGSGPAPLGRQITCMVIYYFTPVTPLGFVIGPAVYIVGTATLQATY